MYDDAFVPLFDETIVRFVLTDERLQLQMQYDKVSNLLQSVESALVAQRHNRRDTTGKLLDSQVDDDASCGFS
jgi:hypothetical protein